jgi:hypothetical protein
MKTLLPILFLLMPISSFSQYSNYYNIDVKQDVNVSGEVNVTENISTIDYGELALANAQSERNRLEIQKYTDEREKNIYFDIAQNPLMAYDYGELVTAFVKGEQGFKKISISYMVPHKSLFVFAGQARLENVSTDGITTEINFYLPQYSKETVNVEKLAKMESMNINKMNIDINRPDSIFVLKKDVNRASVFGNKGFVSTLIWEDNYQVTITDNYRSYTIDGIYHKVKVRYYGDKDEVTFKQLEGRKYYLKRLIEKIISTGTISDYKFDI